MRHPLSHTALLLMGLLSLAPSASAQGECVIRAPRATLRGLTVRPEGEAPFQLDVQEVAVEIRPDSDPDHAKVRVVGSLELEALGGQIPLRPTSSRPDRTTTVTLGTSSRLTRPRMSRQGLVVRAQLGAGVVIPALPVDCEGLTVDAPRRRLESPEVPQPDGRALFPRRRRMTLRPYPGAGPAITVLAQHRSMLPMKRLGGRGDAVRVEASWRDGARLRGWVALDEVRWRPAGGYGYTGGWSEPSCPGLGRAGPDAYNGPATIAPGAQVFARAGRGPWAIIRQPGPFSVILWPRSEWARVMRAPDVGRCGLGHAYVRADQVTPTEPERRAQEPAPETSPPRAADGR